MAGGLCRWFVPVKIVAIFFALRHVLFDDLGLDNSLGLKESAQFGPRRRVFRDQFGDDIPRPRQRVVLGENAIF